MLENPPRRLIFDRALVEEREYWHARLRGVAGASAAIPADAPGAGRAAAREEVSFAAPAEVGEGVLRLTRGDPLLAYATVLAALKLCLYRYHGPGTVTVGTPPRLGPGAAPAANVLAVADEVHGGLTFRELLGAVRRSLLEAYARQAYPFPRLLRELELDGAGAPFGVTLSLEGLHGPLLEVDGGPRITLWNHAAVLRGTISYPAGAYLRTTVERFAGHLLQALASGLERPAAALDVLDVSSPAERRRVLEAWNATDRPYPRGHTLHARFEAQAARTPSAVAVECDGEALTYAELNGRANRLARRLRGMGVGPERRVGVCLERSAELVVALLAVLKAGGAYLPLDPAYPPERLRYMWDDSGARVLLTRTPLLGRMGGGLDSGGGVVVCLDGAVPDHDGDAADLPRLAVPENLAYVIYTSGSTGRPKGTLVQHASVVNYLDWFAAEVMGGRPCDLPLLSRISFDGSVRQLYPPLLSGGRVWLPTEAVAAEPAALARALDRPGRLMVGCVPSLWSLLLEVVEAGGAELRGLEMLMLGGEVLAPELVARTRARFPGVVIWNHYGPTEATVNAAAGRVDGARVTLGRPLANVRAYVLDAGGRPVPLGAAGELCVGGAAPARGYLGRPGLTAERFVPDPFGPGAGGRLYRTGDRARWSADGELEYRGRTDAQVKVRGYRVEPGEIEALLGAHPGVRAAVVAMRGEGAGAVLAAYVVGMGAEPDPRALRAYLAERLPDYMVPGAFVTLDRLPLTPSGKVDRGALPAPAAGGDGDAPHQATRTPAEETLAAIWREVLGLERVGAEENFFELGGHSLVAMRVVTRAGQAFGVELPMRAVFEAQTVRALAERVEALRAAGGAGVETPPVVPVPRGGGLRLSFAQQRLWFLDQLEPGGAAYNIPVALRLRGGLNVAALARALTALVHRHEVLRTTFAAGEGGEAVQVIHTAAPVPLPVVDLSGVDASSRAGLVERLVGEEAARPFDLARGPVLRCALLRLGPGDAVVLFTLHHVAGDAWSTEILVREVSALYAAFARGGGAGLAGLPALPVQYADYAEWQRGRLEGEVLETQLAYWRERLSGAPPVLELPLDHPRPALAGGRAASHAFAVAPGLARAVRELARREGATPYMTLLAAWQALLARYAGTDDVVVGTPVAGRTRVEVENLVGFFVNTLVIRTGLEGEPTFRELVGRVRDGVLEAQAHQDLPFERLVDALEVERSLAHTPVFQVTFTFTAATRGDEGLRLGEVEIESLSADSGTAKFDLALAMSDAGDALSGTVEYRADLFDAGTMERMTGSFVRLLEHAAADPDSPVSAVDLLEATERRQVLEEWNATAAALPADSIHGRFEAQAADTPDALAIDSWEGTRSTYAELNARANRIARRLIRMGAGTDTRVAILMERSADMVSAIYGVLKAGAAYVPIDPGYPAGRIAHMLADAAAPIILTQSSLADAVGDGGAMVIALDVEDLSREEESDPGIDADPESLAYVIYTSGSTGTPKGAAIPHRALANHMAWMQGAFPLAAVDRVLQKTPFSFDASVWEFHAPLLAGAALVLAAPDAHRDPALLVRELRERAITILQVTPTLLGAVLDEPELTACDSLRRLFAGGEALPPGLVRRFREALPSVEMVNLYGPTEVCIDATAHVVDGSETTVPIGRPVHNTRAYVLDTRMLPVGVGIPGELYLGGAQAGRGYLGSAARTAGSFVPDPFAAEPGQRLYRTGDRARWRPDGVLEHRGRIDFQVKVRGVRIEPGEIEGLLREHADVRDAVVVAREDGPGGTWLVAYVVGAAEPDALRAHLAARLPEAMVPGAFVAMDALPLTPGGKVDRRSLPEPARTGGPLDYAPPRTPAEEALAGIWSEVLGLERVSVEDNFFALGGHSLIATRVVSRVRQAFGVELPLRAVFEAQTVRLLAPRVEALHATGVEAWPLVRVSREGGIPLSFAQQRLWFIDQLEPGSAAYNLPVALRLRGALDAKALSRALDEVVRRHEVLRTTFGIGSDGDPVQVVHEPDAVPLPLVDLSSVDGERRQAELNRLAGDEAARPFDLARGPLIRLALLRLAEDDHAVLLTMHHAVSDGWSMEILQREVTALYAAFARGGDAGLAELPDLPVQYADYAVWQRRWLEGEVLERQLAYWRGRLAGAPAVLELPTDRPRPPRPDGRGAAVGFDIAPELARAVRELGLREGATPYMTLLAAWQALLARYTAGDDVVVGTPIAGRTRLETENLVGFFVNTLAIRTRLDGEPAFTELLGRVREAVLQAQAHQDLPFERLVEALEVERSLAHTPVFQVTFTFAAATRGDDALALGDVEISGLEADGGTAKFDLALSIGEAGEGMTGTLAYRTELLDAATAERMARHLVRLLERVTAEPDTAVAAVELLEATERRQVLEEWNATAAALPADSIHRRFEAQAADTPDALAVESGDGAEWTYAELNARANRIAHRLIRMGAGTDTRVAILMERSSDMVAAIYGVLKAGAAYVPIDPGYPAGRIAHMLADAAAPIILTQSSLADAVGDGGAMVIALDVEDLSSEGDSNPGIDTDPESLAYVIYTSGSTGTPKGAAIPHRSLANHMAWMQGAFPLAADDRVLQKTPVSFDASVWEFHAPLLAGAALVLAAPDAHRDPALLVREVRERAITILQVTPTLLGAVLDEPELPACDSLRRLFAGGEALPPGVVRRFHESLPSVEVVNLYGPTEVCIDATAHVADGTGGTVPIGRPVHNTRAYVLDARMLPAGVGIPGELYLGGAQVGRGYLGSAARTAGSFVPDPFAAEPGQRLYRTGDRARWRADGVLEHRGRIDFQVKVRGVRIEPGEIEGLLREHAEVRDAVVVAREDGPGGTWLVAYVVGAAEPDALRAHLAARLPEAMVPGAFVAMDALPITPSGKVNRRALPEPARTGGPLAYAPPRTPAEEALAGIWSEVLGLERVSVEDNFFALGGHSLIATRVVSRVRQAFGVELPLRAVFEAQTVRLLAPRVEALHATGVEAWPLVPVSREGDIPLSFAQQRLWFIDQLEPSSAAYNLPVALRLRGALDAKALSRALDEVVRRHEVLRTTFGIGADGDPVQVVHEPDAVPLPLVDLSSVDGERRQAELNRLAGDEAARPFDLARGPLIRSALLRLAEGDHAVLLTMHHAVSDGWSMEILQREVTALYAAFARGETAALPELPVQYADYAVWQRRWLEGEMLERQLAYWRGRLAGAPAVLELPTARPRPPRPDGRGAAVGFDIAPELARAVRELGLREGATPYMTLLAAWQALLARYTGGDDVVVGTPIAGRTRLETENLVGFFVNTLAIRTRLDGEPAFTELLGRVREAVLQAQAHQDLPFERLVEALEVERSLAHTPVFQVTFTFAAATRGDDALRLGDVEISGLEADGGTAKFDLALSIGEAGEGMTGTLAYRTELFDAATAERMGQHLVRLLERVTAEPDTAVAAVELLDAVERRQVLEEWNATAAPAANVPVHRRFEAQAARVPHAVAVEWDDGQLAYGELNARADELACRLRRVGVGPETLVGLCLRRSPELVLASLAVLKAGGAYVPADPDAPAERLRYMLADSGARVVLTHAALREQVEEAAGAATTVFALHLPGAATGSGLVDEGGPGAEPGAVDPPGAGAPPRAPEEGGEAAGADALAYVIYTSGSTGRPKGVMVSHGSLANLVAWHLEAFAVTEADRCTQVASPGFDAAVWEVWPPLCAGARLCVVPEAARAAPVALRDWMTERGVSVAFLPTPLAEGALAVDWPGQGSPRLVLTGGDRLAGRPAPGLPWALVNNYGPTENTVVSTSGAVAPRGGREARAPSIGRPVQNTRAYVLDAALRPVPVGLPGELCVGGAGVARGYLRRPALTAGAFVPDPFATAPGGRLYRTGDRVRWRADGELEFLGRVDFQVKVRGYRIEPGEIEGALREHPGVREAVVVAREDAPGDTRLAAYVVGAAGPAPDAAELRRHLTGRLPRYMVPSSFVALDAFPLNPNGKVDRAALPAPAPAAGERAYVAPRDAQELEVVRAFEELLGVAPVGVRDDFFALGGHSLLVVRLLAVLEASTGVRLPVQAAFTAGTPEGFARMLREQGSGRDEPLLVPIRRGGTRRPLFLVHAAGGNVLSYATLARRLGPEQPVYALRARGLAAGEEPHAGLLPMAAEYVQAVRAAQPRGPYQVAGWSLGGVVALEMARQLEAAGERVSILATLDSELPGPGVRGWTDEAILLEQFALHLGFPAGLGRARADGSAPPGAGTGLAALLDAARGLDLLPPDLGEAELERMFAVFQSNVRAFVDYLPAPVAAPIALLVAGERAEELTAAQAAAWRRLAGGGLEVRTVAGDHFSLLNDPNAAETAGALAALLDPSPAAPADAAAQVGGDAP